MFCNIGAEKTFESLNGSVKQSFMFLLCIPLKLHKAKMEVETGKFDHFGAYSEQFLRFLIRVLTILEYFAPFCHFFIFRTFQSTFDHVSPDFEQF